MRRQRQSVLVGTAWLLVVAAGCASAGWGAQPTGRVQAGQVVRSDTSDDGDDWNPSCGETGGGGDEAWLLEAPVTGVYEIRVSAGYDAVLAVRADGPGGAELACNDDLEGTALSRVRLRLEAGHTYAILVDGYRGDSGPYELSIGAPEAEDVDAEGALRHTGGSP